MNVRSSTRATSEGAERARNEFGRFSGLSRDECPALDQQLAQPLVLGLRAVAPMHVVRFEKRLEFEDPRQQRVW